jgi:hypothetical protein
MGTKPPPHRFRGRPGGSSHSLSRAEASTQASGLEKNKPGTARPRVRNRGTRPGVSLIKTIRIMTKTTTNNRRRRPGRKAQDIRLVWKEQAPEAVFAGKTLADLETAVAALEESSEDLKIKDQARSAAVRTRDEKLGRLSTLLRTVVRGVQGHPQYGEDSPLYRAMGYVPFSERASGLTRRKKAAGDGSQEETAA